MFFDLFYVRISHDVIIVGQASGMTVKRSPQSTVIQFNSFDVASCVYIQSASYQQTRLLPVMRMYFLGCGEASL